MTTESQDVPEVSVDLAIGSTTLPALTSAARACTAVVADPLANPRRTRWNGRSSCVATEVHRRVPRRPVAH